MLLQDYVAACLFIRKFCSEKKGIQCLVHKFDCPHSIVEEGLLGPLMT